MGTIMIGKVESGACKKGDALLVMPNKVNSDIKRNANIYLTYDNLKYFLG